MLNKIYDNIKKFVKENFKFLIVLLVLVLMLYVELPYMIYKSGGTIDLNDRVTTELKSNKDGSISMTYVTVLKGTPAFILLSFILPDWDLVSMDSEFNGEDYNEVIEIGKENLVDGIDHAIIAAFNESNYDITINKISFIVNGKVEESNNTLEIGDEIISVNGKKINAFDDIKDSIKKKKENDVVKIKVINDNVEYERTAKLMNSDNGVIMGITVKTEYDYNTEIPITIKTEKNESGSSGGLMMALSIYDKLTSEDITKGHTIAGTGTISESGVVGEIDGIKYKILAAEKKNAEIFFVPANNYKEAIKIKKNKNLKVKVVKAETLKEVILYLSKLK